MFEASILELPLLAYELPVPGLRQSDTIKKTYLKLQLAANPNKKDMYTKVRPHFRNANIQ